jgi:hypothetical protein
LWARPRVAPARRAGRPASEESIGSDQKPARPEMDQGGENRLKIKFGAAWLLLALLQNAPARLNPFDGLVFLLLLLVVLGLAVGDAIG